MRRILVTLLLLAVVCTSASAQFRSTRNDVSGGTKSGTVTGPPGSEQANASAAQDTTVAVDSLQGFSIKRLVRGYAGRDTLTPGYMLLGTALIPGAAQLYNHDWWKVPVIYAGMGAGVATTVGVNHATPAAFFGHADHRNEYDKLATQLIEADFIDFAAGGGFLNEVRKTGRDSKYFEDKSKEAGIGVFHGKEQWGNLSNYHGRVFCFNIDPARTELKYAMDQKPGDTNLSDFVKAGIDYLYGHFAEKGFVFMVEGGKIDGAGHGDDAACNIKETNDFAAAIDVVLAFYDKHPDETLILVTADHETGGLQLGAGQYEMHPELLKVRKLSEDEINREFRILAGVGADRRPLPGRKVPTYEQVKEFLGQYIGLWKTIEVDEDQEAAFREMYHNAFELDEEEIVESLYSTSNRIVSDAIMYADKKAGYQWSHGSHTGSPLGLYIKGAVATEFNVVTDNSLIVPTIRKVAKF